MLAFIQQISRGTGEYFVANRRAAMALGVSRATVQRLKNKLEEKGHICRISSGGDGAGSTSRFALVEEHPAAGTGEATKEVPQLEALKRPDPSTVVKKGVFEWRGEGEKCDGPPPPARQRDDTAAAAAGATGSVTPAEAARLAVAAFAGRFPAAEVRGHIESNLTDGHYRPEDLAAYLAAGRCPAWPSHLKRTVAAWRDGRRRDELEVAIRQIGDGGLTDARRRADGARACVVKADAERGVVVLKEATPAEPPATAERLRAERERNRTMLRLGDEAAMQRRLSERIAALEAGRPDPHPPPAGPRKRWELRTPEDLAAWTFAPATELALAQARGSDQEDPP